MFNEITEKRKDLHELISKIDAFIQVIYDDLCLVEGNTMYADLNRYREQTESALAKLPVVILYQVFTDKGLNACVCDGYDRAAVLKSATDYYHDMANQKRDEDGISTSREVVLHASDDASGAQISEETITLEWEDDPDWAFDPVKEWGTV
jgi:hypothetical protein